MTQSYTLAELAARFDGCVEGDGAVLLQQVATLEKAQSHQISFLANSKYQSQLSATRAGAVILSPKNAALTTLPRLVVDNPYACFARISALFNPPIKPPAGIHPSVVMGEGCDIHPTVAIAANVVLGHGVKIGADSVIGAGCYLGDGVCLGARAYLNPRVVIYAHCIAGDDLILHSGVVIGADGFGIAMDQGRWIKVPQIGRVVLGNDVEVGANTTIDRGALDDTVIEDGVKLDNQIQIAHNVRIGKHTAIAGCAAIAGSTTIGAYCLISGSARIIGHLSICDHVEIAAHSMVTKSIREPGSYTANYPMSKTEDWRKNAVHLRHLDELVKRVKKLEQAQTGSGQQEE